MSAVKPASLALPLGPLMIDIEGLSLTEADRQRLRDPRVGGMILFGRNYQSPAQLRALTTEVHALRSPRLLIAIDHEGGRVQRCREGFTRVPAMRRLGQLWAHDSAKAQQAARQIGFVLAAELRECGVDLSFTPVLDLDWGRSEVIGERAFHRDPQIVAALAAALIDGLHAAGMRACGKHFPGHGWANADSHHASPTDNRPLTEIMAADIVPYQQLIHANKLAGLMPSHVIYTQVDTHTACFSPLWQRLLREQLAFQGAVFSDDLSMAGAGVVGGVVARVEAAWHAGCDVLLVCNSCAAVDEVLASWQPPCDPLRAARIADLLPVCPLASDFRDLPDYAAGVAMAQALL